MDIQTKQLAEDIARTKYRQKGETHDEACARIAQALADDPDHFRIVYNILREQKFLPAGRIQNAVGAARITTPYNCFVSGTIDDSMSSIMENLADAAETMRRGGGIGFDFSNLRPRNDRISSLDSTASGPISFARIFDAMCQTIASSGHRRGAMMLVLRVDHPDIEEFIRAKRDNVTLTGFNISVGITDEFMDAVQKDEMFSLIFEGRTYKKVSAKALWEEIMRSTWDWAEPGVLFLDTINRKNPLYYCETIAATNPCGEQPLPPHGACLLGSFNLVSFVKPHKDGEGGYYFDTHEFRSVIPPIIRAMDNVIDYAIYPLPEQKEQAKSKRRMGIGVTGLANACELVGHAYGSDAMLMMTHTILNILRDEAYMASAHLAKEKGPFPLYDWDDYSYGEFFKTLPEEVCDEVKKYGLRNSHLLSIAPTGTISLCAGNVSSGIEPVFANGPTRRYVMMPGGERKEYIIMDYAEENYGVVGKSSDKVTAQEHIKVLNLASTLVDSSVSKTCNVGDDVPFHEFKDLYMQAYKGGASGCTTFRAAGKRFGVMEKVETPTPEPSAEACFIDPLTGERTCDV